MTSYAGQKFPTALVDIYPIVAIVVPRRAVVVYEVGGRLLRIVRHVLLSLILPVLGQQTLVISHTLHALRAHLGLLIALRKLVGYQVAVRHLIKHGTASVACENGTDLLHGTGWN